MEFTESKIPTQKKDHEKPFFVTTAIAYPNGKPHMGHALEIIQADALVRYYRLKGEKVIFQTGTDEHGKKNWQSAEKEGKSIMQFLDENVACFQSLYKQLNISHDIFIRTSNKDVHYSGAQQLWTKLQQADDLEKRIFTGLYCVGCEGYKTEKDLVDGKCPDHPTREVENLSEENYFFKLSKYQHQLSELITKDEMKITPASRKQEILNFLKEVKDISFSRPSKSLPWGVPVPGDNDHVMYVWCDALTNYITGIGYGWNEDKFNEIWPADVHVIGKDILRFHAVYWPAMLLSAKLPVPKELLVHGFVKIGGLKMGKSTGNVVDPVEQANKYGVDQFRFYLLGAVPLDGDGEYSSDTVEQKISGDFADNFSNFCYRTLSMVKKTLGGRITKLNKNDPIISKLSSKFKQIIDHYEKREFNKAISEILETSAMGNKYLQDNKPWENTAEAPTTLTLATNLVKNLCVLIHPITPGISDNLKKQLNWDLPLLFENLGFDLENHTIGQPEILVRRIS